MLRRTKACLSFLLALLTVLPLFAACGGDVSLGGEETAPGETTDAVETAPPVRDYLEEYPLVGGIPTMYIDLDNDFPLSDITKDEYVSATCTLVGESAEDDILSATLEIRGRGNYSWDLDKKPYAIKFTEKQRVLGMGSARRWVLIANYSDKTFMRNYLTLNLAEDMGMDYVSDCEYVNLVVNGEYNGLYLLTEKIEIHADRVDIDIEAGDVLMEIDLPERHNYECDYCIDVFGTAFPRPGEVRIQEPKPEDYDEAFMAEVYETAKNVVKRVVPAINRGFSTVEEVIDVDSFVDWYILNEFVKNHDSALWTSCFCYIEDGKLHMGPAWDYDTCMGNQAIASCLKPEGFYISEEKRAFWFYRLMQNAEFKSRVEARWRELRDTTIFEDMIASVNETFSYIGPSVKLDNERWPEGPYRNDLRGKLSTTSCVAEVLYVKDWLQKRLAWLDKNWYPEKG